MTSAKLDSIVKGFFLLAVFLLISVIFLGPAHASHIPAPSGFVSDFANVLTQEQKTTLENSLREYEERTGNEIAVALVKSLEGENIDDFTVKVFEEWKIGKKGSDNGILFLAAIEDRKMRIEVGYGLEPYLTDGEAGEIIRDVIAPEFKKGDYYAGTVAGMAGIENQISTEGSPTQKTSSPLSRVGAFFSIIGTIAQGVVFALGGLAIVGSLLVLLVYITSFFARSKSIWAGGIVGALFGVFIGLVSNNVLAGTVTGVILGAVGLLLDWWLSKNYKKLKKLGKKTGWWNSKGGFFAGGGKGGSGGFGGGSSGGGGASGGW